jgi:hypothetical protein
MFSFSSFWNHARSVPVFIRHAWTREYQDVKLILEQNGDLKYFNIPSGFQRIFARGAVITSVGLVATILVLGITSLMLGFSRARLEKSQLRWNFFERRANGDSGPNHSGQGHEHPPIC